MKLRGTRVRREGLGLLLRSCLALQGLRCNVMDVLQAMSSYLKVNYKARNSFHNLLRRMARGVMVPL